MKMVKIEKVKREKVIIRNRAAAAAAQQKQEEKDTVDPRLIRYQYRRIKKTIREKRDEIASVDSDKFTTVMTQVEDLHKLVRNPREQVADAEALLDLSRTLLTCAKSYTRGGVTPSDFISCLLRDFTKTHGKGEYSELARNFILWKEIGLGVSPIFKNFRGCSTMLGPMQTELKKRKVAVYRKRAKPAGYRKWAIQSQPEKVSKTGAEERMGTDENIVTMFDILKKKKSVKLESLILNRKSFAQTVENLFALSFLVKDGRVVMTLDEKGSHHVSPKNAPGADSIMSGESTYSHFVFRYDFKDWQLMMAFFPVGEELMPNRDFDKVSSCQVKTEANESKALMLLSQMTPIPQVQSLVHSPEIGNVDNAIRMCKSELEY